MSQKPTTTFQNSSPLLVAIDGTGLAYRFFYALKNLSTSRGFPTGAVFGFARFLLKLVRDFKFEYCLVAFDVSRKTFRTEISKDYKSNRKPVPSAFKVQMPFIKRFAECIGFPVIEKEGYEADDIIGTVAKKVSKNCKVLIVTSDKDMRQLISENVSVLFTTPKQEKLYDLKTFIEEFGFHPSLIPDIFALSGDKIDNIPGVPGIGEKTAIQLIKEFGSLENLYKNIEKTGNKAQVLKKYEAQAFNSKKLSQINTEVPVEIDLESLKRKEPKVECLLEIASKLEMKTVSMEVLKLFGKPKTDSSKKLEVETLKKLLATEDLLNPPECALIPGVPPIVSVEEGYSLVSQEEVLEILPKYGRIYTFGLKETYHLLGEKAKEFPFVDVSLCWYLINPLQKSYSPEAVYESVMHLPITSVVAKSSEFVKVGRKVLSELKKENLERVYWEIEHPLAFVLYEMEKRGIKVDVEYLKELEKVFENYLSELEENIWKLSGTKFNLNSPKQLSSVLFGKLGLKPVKRTKTGFSTDTETLTYYAQQGIEIAKLLLEYRKISKLNSTFVKSLLKHVGEDGRIHTTFIQTGTATGRLACANPNLQNLPVSDEISKKIRQAIVPSEGFKLVWADYSQIELRILAHLSEDEELIKAFKSGKDIHGETALKLFGTTNEELRRIAKMVNFGIIYGMTPSGLAERLGIPYKEAKTYIDKYFETFKGVKNFIEKVIETAYREGAVRTIFGRKRPLPELFSPDKTLRNFGERAGVNATVQGSAADIVKVAMIKLHEELKELGGYILLQVHDELVVEVPEEKVEEGVKVVKEVMESAGNLRVPLEVNVEVGERWT